MNAMLNRLFQTQKTHAGHWFTSKSFSKTHYCDAWILSMRGRCAKDNKKKTKRIVLYSYVREAMYHRHLQFCGAIRSRKCWISSALCIILDRRQWHPSVPRSSFTRSDHHILIKHRIYIGKSCLISFLSSYSFCLSFMRRCGRFFSSCFQLNRWQAITLK